MRSRSKDQGPLDTNANQSEADPSCPQKPDARSGQVYIRIIDYGALQTHKGRRPPWIKLHASWLDDPDFNALTATEKWTLVALMLLASKHGNRVQLRMNWLRTQLQLKHNPNITKLQDAGFIEIIENNDVKHRQSVPPEVEVETETETETEVETEVERADAHTHPPYSNIFDLWNSTMPEHVRVTRLTDELRGLIKPRWEDNPDLHKWQKYFEHIACSDFLTGRVSRNGKPFVCHLKWAIASKQRIDEIWRGKYHSENISSAERIRQANHTR